MERICAASVGFLRTTCDNPSQILPPAVPGRVCLGNIYDEDNAKPLTWNNVAVASAGKPISTGSEYMALRAGVSWGSHRQDASGEEGKPAVELVIDALKSVIRACIRKLGEWLYGGGASSGAASDTVQDFAEMHVGVMALANGGNNAHSSSDGESLLTCITKTAIFVSLCGFS